jgi:hypothetical protein
MLAWTVPILPDQSFGAASHAALGFYRLRTRCVHAVGSKVSG